MRFSPQIALSGGISVVLPHVLYSQGLPRTPTCRFISLPRQRLVFFSEYLVMRPAGRLSKAVLKICPTLSLRISNRSGATLSRGDPSHPLGKYPRHARWYSI